MTTLQRVLAGFLLVCSVLLISAHRAEAQGIVTGTVFGTVVDPAGAVVPNAAVKATNLQNGSAYTTTTQSSGLFSLRNLSIGTYQITIDSAGFGTHKLPTLNVAAGDNTDLRTVTLSVQAATQSVTVAGQSAQLLTTQQAQSSASLDSVQLQDLPFDANFDNAALLNPGVARAHNDSFSNSNGSDLSVDGERARSNNFEIDGQSNNDNSIGGSQIFFGNQDALAEIQTITNNFSAQYGHDMGSVVNYVTKSGTNQFHGTGFEFYTGSFLSSLSNQEKSPVFGFCPPGVSASTGCLPVVVPRTVDNRYGGTLGGPILKNKLWFFGSTYWEHTRDGASPGSSGTRVTPTPTGLTQLASDFPGNPAVAAVTGSGPFGVKSGNPIVVPGTAVNKPVSDGTTTQQVQFGAVERLVPALFNDQEEMGKGDWQPTDKDHLFLRYIYQNELVTGPLANGGGAIAAGSYIDITDTAHSVGGDWTHTFSPEWVDQLRYSFQQTKLFFQGGGDPACTSTNFTACPSNLSLGGGFESFGYATNIPQGRTVKVNQVQDNANWTHGSHSIAFGGEYDYQNSPNVFLPDYNGGFQYANFNSFLQDKGNLNLGNGNPVAPFKETDVAAYFQDDWRIRNDLTLNLGMRWEFFGQAVNLLNKESVAQQTGPNPFWNKALPLSQTTFQAIPQYYKNFEPRLGFAYNPQNILGGRLVVRGGYAITVDPIYYNIFLNAATSAPVINLGQASCGASHECLPSSGISGAAVRAQNLSQIPTGGNPGARGETNVTPNFRNPTSQTYTLGTQYQLSRYTALEVRYVGVHTSGNFQSLDNNPNLLAVSQAFPNVVNPTSLCQDPTALGYGHLRCDQTNVRTRANTAFSIYNALQAQLRTSNYKGLTGTVSYTRSRTIDNVSEIFGTYSGGTTVAFAQNPLHTNRAERGVSGTDYPNLASIALTYAVPTIGNPHGLVGRVINGFVVNSIWGYNSGTPNNPFQYLFSSIGDTSYDDLRFDEQFIGVNTERPILLNKSAPIGTVAIYVPASEAATTTTSGTPGYYVYNAFDQNGLLNQSTSPTGAHWLWSNKAAAQLLGNPYPGVPRNTLRGQAYNNLDADIYKNTALFHGVNVQLQMSAFNVLNHQYIGTPDTFIEDYTPTGVNSFMSGAFLSSNNRTIQLGAKVLF